MVDKNNSKSEYEKFIVSNAAFSFLTSTCCVEYLHAFIKNYNMCLKENGEKIDDTKNRYWVYKYTGKLLL